MIPAKPNKGETILAASSLVKKMLKNAMNNENKGG